MYKGGKGLEYFLCFVDVDVNAKIYSSIINLGINTIKARHIIIAK